ncbi:MAG: PEP-CTERM sorting domain-containing protein [bacterium]
MRKILMLLIIFSLSSFISLAKAANISRNLSIGNVLDAQDFLFDSALGTLEKVLVETYSDGWFYYQSVDPPPYSNNVEGLAFYYENQYILKVENINLGSRIHQEFDFGDGDGLCSFNGDGQAMTGAGTWGIQGEFYSNPDILSFFTLKENDTSVSLTNVFKDIFPGVIYDDLGKKYEFSDCVFNGEMIVNYFYAPVPEPSSFVFLLFGVLGLAAIRKKKKGRGIPV